MRHHYGQVGMENIFLFGALLVFLVAILFVTTEMLSFNYRLSLLQDSVDNLVLTANTLQTLGEKSGKTVSIYLPKGVTGASLTGNVIAIASTRGGELQRVSGTTKPRVIGELPQSAGYYTVEAETVAPDLVKFGDAPYVGRLEPSSLVFSSLPLTLKIFGVDFEQARVKVNGFFYPDGFITQISPIEIHLQVVPGFFPPAPGGAEYSIVVVNGDGRSSNPLIFTIFPAGSS